jgi:N-acetylglutamate synthase-like GNAT family acetyltransferase
MQPAKAPSAAIEIVNLQAVPHLADTCAAWSFGEWGCLFGTRTLEDVITRYRGSARAANALPMTFIALVNGKPAGMASLKADDHPDCTDLTPWLASVYVHPMFRGQGLSAPLLDAVEQAARDKGFKEYYLFTGTAEALYAKSGWQTVKRVRDPSGLSAGLADTLMKKEL